MTTSSNVRDLTNLSHYDYELPPTLIAQQPAQRRTQARLLYLKETDRQDTYIRNLPQILRKGDVLVFNNTRVQPSRLLAHKSTGGVVEILITRMINSHQAEALLGSSRPIAIGSHIFVQNHHHKEIKLTVIAKQDTHYKVETTDKSSLVELCHLYGQIPLPPYIRRAIQPSDKQRYQTILAKKDGSAAAPTAGLHFNRSLLGRLEAMGVKILELTLHIGLATFSPIRTNDITNHRMHSEWCHLSHKAADILNHARANRHRIIAVGTTSLRTLETAFNGEGFHSYEGETSLFIHPTSPPIQSADLLLTNFHLPKSSLLLLVCAFGGYERIMQAYRHAVSQKYRFFSYGDAMLITKKSLSP